MQREIQRFQPSSVERDSAHRASPWCSPNNSDDEEEEDVDNDEGGEIGTTRLVFGHSDESEDESDD